VQHREWLLRLEDMLKAMQRINRFIRTLTFQEFCDNEMAVDAVIRNVELIGEAARFIPTDFENQHPEIPWASMRGMRNIMIHRYFDTDLGILWNTVSSDVPPLIPIVERLLAAERGNEAPL